MILASAMLGAALAPGSWPAAAPPAPAITVSQAWVRATVAGQGTTGAYLRVESDQEVALVGASADVAAQVQMHEMRMDGSMMTMTQVQRLTVAPGHPLVFDEHGYHFMLEGLRRQVRAGERVELKLHFVDRAGVPQDVATSAIVRELSAHGSPAKP
jgi:copper(I)-binding protein